ncbi:MAG: magnesium transporter [Anaerofustis stercorihominis]|nr:magnesium transporter [Anaerofustis stercorihominis]
MENRLDFERLTELIERKDFRAIKEEMADMYAADAAWILGELEPKEIVLVFRLIPKEEASEVFSYLDIDSQEIIVNAVTDSELSAIMDELYVDDAVDLIEELPAGVVKRVLKCVDSATRETINRYLKYEEDTAGTIMTSEYINLKSQMSVKEAFAYIKRKAGDTEDISNCFVIDKNRILEGAVSLKTLILADEDALIGDIMVDEPIFVYTNDDKEHVASVISHYDLTTVPVVDIEKRLVGIVTIDDAVEVIQEEATEDFEIMAGMHPSEKPYLKTGVFSLAKNRIVWLLFLMASATITGSILSTFEESLAVIPILVSFVPMLMGTGGNSGSQASTLIIRGMAVDEIRLKDFPKVLFKEVRVGLICGGALGIVCFAGVYFLYGRSVALALTVALTIAATVLMAKSLGCIMPMAAKAVKLDPALMASALITTIVDACSLLVYFAIVNWILL